MMNKDEVRQHLTNDLIPFWCALKDQEHGGFYGYMDEEGVIDKEAEKGCILNNRILWFFSNAAMVLQDRSLIDYAGHAFRFLRDHAWDNEQGGVYWSMTYDGRPADETKHTYNQAFAIYGLASYYDASGNREAFQMAMELFHIIEEKCLGERGYKEAFTRAFEEASNEKLSENGVMAYHTMNTLLHVMEAYTELYRVMCKRNEPGSEQVRERLLWILAVFKKDIFDAEKGRQKVFFDREMNSLIDLYSYGHDIETSWLLDRTLEVLGDQELLNEYGKMTARMATEIYAYAFDGHSLANECENGVVDEKRIWWVQAETVLGFLNAYEKSGDEKYRDAANAVWEFIKSYVITARKPAEWHSEVNRDGSPRAGHPLVDPWKCPYHNGRMCIEILSQKVE